MSHLTANNVHKSYLFELPRSFQPMTPPETDYETPTQPFRQPLRVQTATPAELEPISAQVPASSLNETPLPYHRRKPSLTYINSGIRESRERVVHRGIKWLVVVIPPVSFAREHGHLGHTLSSGSPSRLASGILMPLFPTMNGQLVAIAREFSLPSIAGICLYLHTTHNGIALCPRVSDDSWPLLWSHLFDARSPTVPSQQMPISGQVEFDIDFVKARWYDAWLASARREYMDVPQSVTPSRVPSVSHGRDDSRTTIADEQADEQADSLSFVQQSRAALAPSRNIKKLSLLDRFDSVSARSGSKLVPRNLSPPSPNSTQNPTSQALSPIVQESEPGTVVRGVDSLVNSWRASAAISRSPLAATGQTSLDPANMPNMLGDLPTASTSDTHSEFNLDDYTWSVSSVGPLEYDDVESIASWDRVPSVHMDRRLEGSVCLTPSVCTSFGPPDDDDEMYSPVSYSRLPSPDIARRVMEDVPATPSTATSWGPPSYPPSADGSEYGALSVDLGRRLMSSRPVTPATATSWGPASCPSSPAHSEHSFRVASPDLGERKMSSVPGSPILRSRPWKHVWPYTEQHDAALPSQEGAARPYEFVFPCYDASKALSWPHVNDATSPKTEPSGTQQEPARPYGLVYPYYDAATASTWRHVWPYVKDASSSQPESSHPGTSEMQEDAAGPYPFVYPYYNAAQESTWSHVTPYSTGAPPEPVQGSAHPYKFVFPYYNAAAHSAIAPEDVLTAGPWKQVWPYAPSSRRSSFSGISTADLSSSYPYFNLYPAVYPSFDLYPCAVVAADDASENIHVSAGGAYPSFDLYPAVYPSFDLYPAGVNVAEPTGTANVSIGLEATYPVFDIYPAVYPDFRIYANTTPAHEDSAPAATDAGSAMTIQAVSNYPVFELYPAVEAQKLDRIMSSTTMTTFQEPASIVIPALSHTSYPTFDLYPPAYPTDTTDAPPIVESFPLSSQYPALEIYPAVYPHNLRTVYPAVVASDEPGSLRTVSTGIATGVRVQYPLFDIYPTLSRTETAERFGVALPKQYPSFDIYPAMYPHNLEDIYPPISIRQDNQGDIFNGESAVKLAPRYPVFELYDPVYPSSLDHIYPSTIIEPVEDGLKVLSSGSTLRVKLSTTYPAFELYPPVYPYNLTSLYPAISVVEAESMYIKDSIPSGGSSVSARSSMRPHVAAVRSRSRSPSTKRAIPPVPPLPQYARNMRPSSSLSRQSLPADRVAMSYVVPSSTPYPVICPYPPVYPFFALYPEIATESIRDVHPGVPVALGAQYPAFDLYPAVYPAFEIYPPVLSEVVAPQEWTAPVVATPDTVSPKTPHRRPTFSHRDLHDQVFNAEREPLKDGSSPQIAGRRPTLSHQDLDQQVPAAEHEALKNVSAIPAPKLQPPVPEPRLPPTGSSPSTPLPARPTIPSSRRRSGTVSSRPNDLPPPPADVSRRQLSNTPNRGPSSPDSSATTTPGLRRVSSARVPGLPAHPSVNRRLSSTPSRSISSTLPALREPRSAGEAIDRRPSTLSPLTEDDTERAVPSPSKHLLSPDGADSGRSTMMSSPKASPPGVSESQQSATLPPARPSPRLTRSSVMERARAYDVSPVDDTPVKLMSALSQFPAPPVPPPSGRPMVSKLDRTKYPFA